MTSDEVEVRYSRSKLIGLCSNQLTINIFIQEVFKTNITLFGERFPQKSQEIGFPKKRPEKLKQMDNL